MADVTTYLDEVSGPTINTSIRNLQIAQALASDAANSGDNIQLFTVPIGAKWRISNVDQRVSATLGASCTVQAQINRAGTRTALAAASTAAAASKTSSVAQAGVPFDAVGGDIIELVVAGADTTAAATVTLDLSISDRQ